jgi:hypothetical protein
VAFAQVIGAPARPIAPGFPDEVAVVFSEEIGASAAITDIADDLVPGAFGILPLGKGEGLRHRRSSSTTILSRVVRLCKAVACKNHRP